MLTVRYRLRDWLRLRLRRQRTYRCADPGCHVVARIGTRADPAISRRIMEVVAAHRLHPPLTEAMRRIRDNRGSS